MFIYCSQMTPASDRHSYSEPICVFSAESRSWRGTKPQKPSGPRLLGEQPSPTTFLPLGLWISRTFKNKEVVRPASRFLLLLLLLLRNKRQMSPCRNKGRMNSRSPLIAKYPSFYLLISGKLSWGTQEPIWPPPSAAALGAVPSARIQHLARHKRDFSVREDQRR